MRSSARIKRLKRESKAGMQRNIANLAKVQQVSKKRL